MQYKVMLTGSYLMKPTVTVIQVTDGGSAAACFAVTRSSSHSFLFSRLNFVEVLELSNSDNSELLSISQWDDFYDEERSGFIDWGQVCEFITRLSKFILVPEDGERYFARYLEQVFAAYPGFSPKRTLAKLNVVFEQCFEFKDEVYFPRLCK